MLPMARNCSALRTPLGTLRRNMNSPGVLGRQNMPYHFSRN